ncbi:MAG: 2-oxo acid dehydrogenase subunit E2 [Burkholderiaceae bacterium]
MVPSSPTPTMTCRCREEDCRIRSESQEGKISLDDMTRGTFSIFNGGTFRSMMSTPIINPPQSAILGVHATKERAMVENDRW